MKKPLLKICGITRMEDIVTLNVCDVDYVGFIFDRKSPRFISSRDASMLSRELAPTIQPVGVFVNSPVDVIVRTARNIRATMVQAHGNIPDNAIKEIQKEGLRVAVSLHVKRVTDWKRALKSAGDFVLLDNRDKDRAGGTGEPFDWSIRPPRRIANLILAGGLNEKNFRRGAKLFRPVMIDVNSGVESSPGVKSKIKLKRFVDRYRATRWSVM